MQGPGQPPLQPRSRVSVLLVLLAIFQHKLAQQVYPNAANAMQACGLPWLGQRRVNPVMRALGRHLWVLRHGFSVEHVMRVHGRCKDRHSAPLVIRARGRARLKLSLSINVICAMLDCGQHWCPQPLILLVSPVQLEQCHPQ